MLHLESEHKYLFEPINMNLNFTKLGCLTWNLTKG